MAVFGVRVRLWSRGGRILLFCMFAVPFFFGSIFALCILASRFFLALLLVLRSSRFFKNLPVRLVGLFLLKSKTTNKKTSLNVYLHIFLMKRQTDARPFTICLET